MMKYNLQKIFRNFYKSQDISNQFQVLSKRRTDEPTNPRFYEVVGKLYLKIVKKNKIIFQGKLEILGSLVRRFAFYSLNKNQFQ